MAGVARARDPRRRWWCPVTAQPTNHPTSHEASDTHSSVAGGGSDTPDDHERLDTQSPNVVGGPSSLPGQLLLDAQPPHAGQGPISPESQRADDAHPCRALGGPDTATAIGDAIPMHDSRLRLVPPTDQLTADTQGVSVGGGPDPAPAANEHSAPTGPSLRVLGSALKFTAEYLTDIEKVRTASENRHRTLTRCCPDGCQHTPEDRAAGVCKLDRDGHQRGLGLDDTHPDVAVLGSLVRSLRCGDKPRRGRRLTGDDGEVVVVPCCLEHEAERNLRRVLRRHPLYGWVQAQKGVGDKQAARLLAAVGDPYIRPRLERKDGTVEESRPRTVSELWAYCGLHTRPASQGRSDTQPSDAGGGESGSSNPDQRWSDAQSPSVWVAARRQKGQRANWSSDAKIRALLVAESCKRQLTAPCHRPDGSPYATHVDDCTCSPWRVLYDLRRAETTSRVHTTECLNRSRITPNGCGTREHPEWGAVGSPWRPGHQEQDAVRIVAKQILKSLWHAARDLHTAGRM